MKVKLIGGAWCNHIGKIDTVEESEFFTNRITNIAYYEHRLAGKYSDSISYSIGIEVLSCQENAFPRPAYEVERVQEEETEKPITAPYVPTRRDYFAAAMLSNVSSIELDSPDLSMRIRIKRLDAFIEMLNETEK